MAYEVIARRWRPKVFEEVVGQRHVTETLKNAVATNRVPHALLFAGPRGVGKTTTARIMAKALNCDHGPTPTPCGTCPACEEIAGGRSMDCIEVDAASNTQVEKMRDLLETVQYAPTHGRHKIYIIDEAHMLSASSFNALLKTLEEPPPRVVFILATTEPHRILATIHSRCQRHDFRLLGRGRDRRSVCARSPRPRGSPPPRGPSRPWPRRLRGACGTARACWIGRSPVWGPAWRPRRRPNSWVWCGPTSWPRRRRPFWRAMRPGRSR